jgi:hypothetical protein
MHRSPDFTPRKNETVMEYLKRMRRNAWKRGDRLMVLECNREILARLKPRMHARITNLGKTA